MPTYAEATAAFQQISQVLRYGGSAVGTPKEKIRIEPLEVPVPEKTPAPVEQPVEEPVEVPA